MSFITYSPECPLIWESAMISQNPIFVPVNQIVGPKEQSLASAHLHRPQDSSFPIAPSFPRQKRVRTVPYRNASRKTNTR